MNSSVNSKHHLQCVCLSLFLHSCHNQNGYRVFKVYNTVFKDRKNDTIGNALHQMDYTYPRGQSQGRSQCVPRKDAQQAARRWKRHFLAGLKDPKAGIGKYRTLLALWGFISCSNCCSQSCFTPASPCGISRRHGESPAKDWQLTLGTGRSPRGCRWQDQETGWCAVWYVPSVLGYCRDTQISLLSHPNLSWPENS